MELLSTFSTPTQAPVCVKIVNNYVLSEYEYLLKPLYFAMKFFLNYMDSGNFRC